MSKAETPAELKAEAKDKASEKESGKPQEKDSREAPEETKTKIAAYEEVRLTAAEGFKQAIETAGLDFQTATRGASETRDAILAAAEVEYKKAVNAFEVAKATYATTQKNAEEAFHDETEAARLAYEAIVLPAKTEADAVVWRAWLEATEEKSGGKG